MRTWTKLAMIQAVHLMLLCSASADMNSIRPLVLYNLLPGSSFHQGCVAPCMCLLTLSGRMEGTFVLAKDSMDPDVHSYTISDIDWKVIGPVGNVMHTVTGEGAYTRQPLRSKYEKHRLTLKLSIDGADPVSLDSGEIAGCCRFPDIVMTVDSGSKCMTETMDIFAAP